MSGSGSAVYGLFESETQAKEPLREHLSQIVLSGKEHFDSTQFSTIHASTTHLSALSLATHYSQRNGRAGLGCSRCDSFSGDVCVDHPAFGAAVVGRFLESLGLKVAIVPQPNWRTTCVTFANSVAQSYFSSGPRGHGFDAE